MPGFPILEKLCFPDGRISMSDVEIFIENKVCEGRLFSVSNINGNINSPDRTDADNSTVLFRAVASGHQLKKNLMLVVFALLLGLFLVLPYLLHALSGNWSFASQDELIHIVYALGFCLPFAVILFKSIKYNQVIITNDRIFVHMGVSATSITIPVDELQGYYLERHTSRAGRSFNLVFWYKNESKVRSGTLYLNDDDLEEIIQAMETKLNLPVLEAWEIISRGGLINKENVGPGIKKKINYFSLLITVSCFAAVIMSAYFLYFRLH